MSFHWKVFLLSVGILLFIIGTTIGTSLYVIHRGIKETILWDLSVMSKIAERLVSSEINLLKARAWTAVHFLEKAPQSKWNSILEAQVETNDYFLSITVFNMNGTVVANYGEPMTPPAMFDSPYAQMAIGGQTVISSTRSLPTGELVIHVCVPLDKDHVASVTVPGLYFSRILSHYRVWDTGSVFILDETGKVVASESSYMVLGEYNVLEDPTDDRNTKSLRDFTTRMIKGGHGPGRYILENRERLGYFTSIEGSSVGWTLGLSAPLSESPLNYVDQALVLMTLVFLSLGVLIAWFTAGFVDRQFNIINQQYNNLAELSEIAHNSSEAKTNFLANMSHEMRTPLNAIIGFSELMIYGRIVGEEKRENLSKIHSAGLTLLGLVNDILDISKIESGHFELIEVEYDISSLINDTVTVNLIRLGEKPVEFGLEIDKSIPGRLVGDELRIKQICTNILSNAFKYTMEGSVNMLVTAEFEGETVWLSIQVKDTGVGIKPEDLSKLFSDYSQVGSKSVRRIEGTGLGLSITKKMVDMMGGRIEVESEYGKGSTFTVVIRQKARMNAPLGPKAAENNENIRVYKSIHSGEREISLMPYAKILVVDDVQANLDVAMGILKPYKMRIDCVTSGQRAVDLIRDGSVRYDAVFMDHMMPEMDGIEAVRIIREEIGTEYAQNVPIIALTANALIGNDKMFLDNGFQAYLTKPIEIFRLDVVLRKWVFDAEKDKKFRGESDGAAASGQSKASGPIRLSVPGLNLGEALERFGGDEEVLISVLKSYAESMSDLLGSVKNPSREDVKNYGITVHGIKSSSYGVGAKEVGDLARELESRAEGGDFDFILANNRRFVKIAEKLIADIGLQLKSLSASADAAARRAAPDPQALLKLREAAQSLDMDGMESALDELASFSYEAGDDQIVWLREQADQSAFAEIVSAIDENGVLIAPPPQEPKAAKSELDEPDWALLTRLGKAAGDFDMDKVDTYMEELTAHSYRKHGDLVEWIQDRINSMEFADVNERVTSLVDAVGEAAHGAKPVKGAPDPAVLERLRQACQSYDMDGVDGAMSELEAFNYDEGEELATWLKTMVSKMEFGEILKRLSGGAA
jgi:signal transduction histidine kinase/CheY-like chemotaxis protein